MNIEKLFYTDLSTFPKSDLIILAKYYKIPITGDFVKVIAKKQANLYKKGNMKTGEQNNEAEILAQATVFQSLFENLDFKEIQNLCTINKKLNENCKEQLFWQKFISKKLKEMVLNGKSKEDVFHESFGKYALQAYSPTGDAFIAAAVKVGNFNKDYLERLLITSSKNDYINSVKNLIQKGVDVNIQDRSGITALIYACYNKNVQIIKLLILSGADINKRDDEGLTPLMNASKHGNLDIVEELLNNHAIVNSEVEGDITALMYASDIGHLDIVTLLLNAGADPNEIDDEGRTALMYASETDHLEIVKLLINAGANPNIKDNHGNTVIDYANNDIQQLLKDYKTDLGFKATKKYISGEMNINTPEPITIEKLKEFNHKDICDLSTNLGITCTNKTKLKLVNEIWNKMVENKYGKAEPRKLESLMEKMCKNLNDDFNLLELQGMAKALGFDYQNKTKSDLCTAIATKIFLEKIGTKLELGDYKG